MGAITRGNRARFADTLLGMTTEVRTPFGAPTDVELSSDGLYRKQILRFETIDYTDKTGARRKITFDRRYGDDLIRAFRDGAYDQVPFQLADANNRHNNSPLLTGGEVVALTLSRDQSGVDAIIKPNHQGRQAVELNAKLGVSARILENATLGGRLFPRAVQHVLGTVDPQVRGMSPWERVTSVDLSAGTVSESLDLSTETYGRSAMPGQDGETVTLELSAGLAALLQKPETAERLEQLLEEDEGMRALVDQLEAAGIDLDDVADDDEDPDDDEEDETELSNLHGEAIELALAEQSAQGQRIIELTAQLAETRLSNEIAALEARGLAPAVIEAARPLLTIESGALELSNGIGPSIDPGDVVRELLSTVIELSNSGQLLIDPDDERGSLQGTDPNDEATKAMLADWASYGA